MSTISSSTTTTTAYKVTADTTGTLVIQTGATPTTAVTVDASQNVGIGTSSPSYKLDVVGSINASVAVRSASDFIGGGASGAAALYANNTGGIVICRGSSSSNDIEFLTNNSERMRIDSSGNVGIGTSSPASILDVRTAGDALANVQSTGTIQSAILNLVGRQSSVDNNWSIVSTGSGLSGAQLRFTRGGWTGTPSMLIDSSSNLQFNSGYGSVATAYGCRAWVNFNGTGAVAIRASANVTSITDNGVGDYTVNFTNAMPDGNYAYHIGSKQDQAGVGDAAFPTNGTPTGVTDGAAGMTTTRIRLRFVNLDGTASLRDQEVVCVSIFR